MPPQLPGNIVARGKGIAGDGRAGRTRRRELYGVAARLSARARTFGGRRLQRKRVAARGISRSRASGKYGVRACLEDAGHHGVARLRSGIAAGLFARFIGAGAA